MNNKLKLIAVGAAAGICNGLFGSGGGTVVVPFLEKYAGLEEQTSHATAILIILPLSIISLLRYSSGTQVSLLTLITICISGACGSILGACFLKKLSGTALRRIFGVFITAAALRMVTA